MTKKVTLLHAYSRSNKGDGLLVDLSLKVVKDALGDDVDVTVVAGDAASFADLPKVVQMTGQSGSTGQKIRQTLGNFAAMVRCAVTGNMSLPQLDPLLADTDVLVGVGGAYLRAEYPRANFIAMAVQVPQLMWATRAGKPTFYLPQSIGPLKNPSKRLILKELAKLDNVCVRDDRSLEFVGAVTDNVTRYPDLATMELGRKLMAHKDQSSYKKGYIIARDLPGKSAAVRQRYIENLQELRRLLPDFEPVIQSRGRGNDDGTFYKNLGWGDARDVKEAIKADGPGVMISVRLHGALEALIAGCPTVHVTYERKGFGAYGDLGIMPYLHKATDFSPQAVAGQAKKLKEGEPFWVHVQEQEPKIQADYQRLVTALRRCVEG